MSIFSAIIGGAANAVKTVVSNVAKTVSAQSQSSSSGSSSSSSSYSPPAYTPPTYNPPTYSNSYSSSNHSYTTQKSYAASGSGGASNTSKGSSSSNEPQTNSPMFTRQDAREYLDEVEFITKTQEAQTQDEIESEQQQQEVLSKALESTVNAAKEMVDKILHPDNKGDKEAENTEAEESEDIEQKQKAEAQQAKEEKEEKEAEVAKEKAEEKINKALGDVEDDIENSLRDVERFKGNGEIDENTNQGSIGDCMFIADIYGYLQSTEHANEINDAIDIVKDEAGNVLQYNVYFKGLNELYTITQDEVDEAATKYKEIVNIQRSGNQTIETTEYERNERLYSRGDDDMTALELAFEKACKNSTNPEFKKLADSTNEVLSVDPTSGEIIYEQRTPELDGTIDYMNGVNENAIAYAFGFDTLMPQKNDYGELIQYFKTNQIVTDLEGEQYLNLNSDVTVQTDNNKEVELESGEKYKVVSQSEDEVVVEKDRFLFGSDEITVSIGDIIKNEWYDTASIDKIFDDYQKNKNSSLVIGGFIDNDMGSREINLTNINNEPISLFKHHAYTVVDVNGDIITLKNPHDTSKDIQVTRESLYKFGFELRYADD